MTVTRWCHRCNGTYDVNTRGGCPHCRGASGSTGRSTTRNRQAQQRFRTAVLERDGYQCTWTDPETGKRCVAIDDLRACHSPRALADYRPSDPAAFHPDAGRTFCGTHDRATDPYAS